MSDKGFGFDADRPEASRRRWVICGLLFAATVINYIDRQMIGVLKPTLQRQLGWSETGYGDIVFWFQAAYALGYLGFGRLVDRVGARLGFAVSMVIWTIGHVAHAAARSVFGFSLARITLGFGEAGNFPAGLKAVAEWFPKRERAFAVGLFNAGANVGAIITPLLIPGLTLSFGWPITFIVTGAFSLIWLAAWLAFYRAPRDHTGVSAAELALIESDPPDVVETVSWRLLIGKRETWAYALAKFLVDPVWWMFLFWLPDFFARTYQLDLKSFGPPLVVIYLASDLGGIVGGWASSRLMGAGLSLNLSRKLTMLTFAVLVIPVAFATRVNVLWEAVAMLSLATAAHQGFATNLFTLPSDLFPRRAVGAVVGLGGALGAVGGMLMAKYAGWILQTVGDYAPIFTVCALLYLAALGIIHLLTPRMAPIETVSDGA